jgi:glycosyltransferase involved in cell wall biosynthesis
MMTRKAAIDIPDLTVLMPMHNNARFLHETVASILNQTYSIFRFLIIDDGSTENNCEIIRSFNDPRIDLIELPENIGITRALNRGLAMIDTPFVARMDADDIAMPLRFERQMVLMRQSGPRVAVVGTEVKCIDAENKTLESTRPELKEKHPSTFVEFLFTSLKGKYCLNHPSVLFKRDVIIRLGQYDETFPIAQDFDLWVRLALAGYEAKIITDPLLAYRIHKNQISTATRSRQLEARLRAYEKFLSAILGCPPPDSIKHFLRDDNLFWEEVSGERKMEEFINHLKILLDKIESCVPMEENEYHKLQHLFQKHARKIANNAKSSPTSNITRALLQFSHTINSKLLPAELAV